MKFLYEKFWVPFFGFILSKFVFLIEGKKKDIKKNRLITCSHYKYHWIHNWSQYILITTKDVLLINENMHGWYVK